MNNIVTDSYTIGMILVPTERACSNLHDSDKKIGTFCFLLPIMNERHPVIRRS